MSAAGIAGAQSNRRDILFLVCGREGSGRELLTRRYVLQDSFDTGYDPTDDKDLRRRFTPQMLHRGQDYAILAMIAPPVPLTALEHQERLRWDVASLESCQVLLLVYAVNDRRSFRDLFDLRQRGFSQRIDQIPTLETVVVAAQADVANESWVVTEEEGRELAAQLGCRYSVTSAMTGDGVDELFDDCIRRAIDRQAEADKLLRGKLTGLELLPSPEGRKRSRHGLRGLAARMFDSMRKKES